ncbi:MAG: glycosyltransferase [Bacteroidia bacterium]|nr:glycosyltransferase [Bacteroidia bacterium]
MRRILVVTGSLRVGGLEKVAVSCMRYADRSNLSFDFLVFGNDSDGYANEVREMGGRIIQIPHSSNPIKHLKNVMGVMKKYGKYDIVHSHIFFNSGIIMLAAFLQCIPVRIAHAHSIKRKGTSLKKRVLFCGLRFLLKFFTTIPCACSSQAGNYLFGKALFSNKGVIVPNIVDVDKFAFSEEARKQIRQKYGIKDTDIVLGQVGRLVASKNQRFLLRLFAEYLKVNASAKLLLVGDGDMKSELLALTKELDIQEGVIFAGTQTNVPDYLSAMDVFVCTSTNEGLGIVLLEAQANGLHCIAEVSAIVDEVINLHNTIVVDGFRDFQMWISKIQDCKDLRNEQSFVSLMKTSSFTEDGLKKVIAELY